MCRLAGELQRYRYLVAPTAAALLQRASLPWGAAAVRFDRIFFDDYGQPGISDKDAVDVLAWGSTGGGPASLFRVSPLFLFFAVMSSLCSLLYFFLFVSLSLSVSLCAYITRMCTYSLVVWKDQHVTWTVEILPSTCAMD